MTILRFNNSLELQNSARLLNSHYSLLQKRDTDYNQQQGTVHGQGQESSRCELPDILSQGSQQTVPTCPSNLGWQSGEPGELA